MISHLVDLELCSAVALKVRTGHLDLTSANRVLSIFEVHKSTGVFQWVEIGAVEYRMARQWISGFATPLRSLDALHLTADIKLSQAAALFGVSHRLLRQS